MPNTAGENIYRMREINLWIGLKTNQIKCYFQKPNVQKIFQI